MEPFENPADFFMDITNGEVKSKLGAITEGMSDTKTHASLDI